MILLDECAEVDIKLTEGTVAMIPVGTVEGHAAYLPQGSDTFIAQELARRVGMRIDDCIVLPPLPYGMSEHYEGTGFPVTLSPETLATVLTEICESLIRIGVTRILVVNGHDGNIASIELAGRRIRKRHNVTIAAMEAWWWCLDKVAEEDPLLLKPDGHAGARETSLMLATRPELVQMVRAVPPEMAEEQLYFNPLAGVRVYATYADYHQPGQYADPMPASAESGERIYEVIVDHIVEFLVHADRVGWQFGSANQPTIDRE